MKFAILQDIDMDESSEQLRIVVVGDEKCGKTSLISRFVTGYK